MKRIFSMLLVAIVLIGTTVLPASAKEVDSVSTTNGAVEITPFSLVDKVNDFNLTTSNTKVCEHDNWYKEHTVTVTVNGLIGQAYAVSVEVEEWENGKWDAGITKTIYNGNSATFNLNAGGKFRVWAKGLGGTGNCDFIVSLG